MRKPGLLAAALLFLSVPTAAPADTLSSIADDYVSLMVSAHASWPDIVVVNAPGIAKAEKIDADTVRARSESLRQRLDKFSTNNQPEAMRARSIRARLVSLVAQLELAGGAKLDMMQRVERIYGFKPEFRRLSDYDPVLDRLDTEMPGPGTLAERIEAMKTAARVPPDRLEAVFRAALAECRRRTLAHMPLPEESTDVQFVHDSLTPAEIACW